MKKLALLLAVLMVLTSVPFTMAAAQGENTAPGKPTGLLTDLMETPLALDSATPAFSWIVNDADKDELQSAYQIIMASSKAKIDANNADVYDTGKVESAESSYIKYEGTPLPKDSIYYWKVRTWDKTGNVSEYSDPQFISTSPDSWTGKPIWMGSALDLTKWTNYTFECKVKITQAAIGITMRAPSTSNWTMVQLRADTNEFKPHRNVNGSISADGDNISLASKGVTLALNQWFTFKVVITGNSYSYYINNTPITTVTKNLQAYGAVGFRSGSSERAEIDDVKVTLTNGNEVIVDESFANNNPFGGGTVSGGVLQVGNSSNFIYTGGLDANDEMIFLRKTFNVPNKPIEKAIASVYGSSTTTAKQYVFEFRMNGEYVGVGPQKMHNGKRFYNNYDVTDLIKQGQANAMGAICFTRADKVFVTQLKIFYKDGTSEVINSDATWKSKSAGKSYGLSGSIGTSYYFAPAENINATIYPFGFDTPAFDDSSWNATTEKPFVLSNMTSSPTEKVIKTYKPVAKIVSKGSNNYFVDIGKEVIGGLKLKINVPSEYEGAVITLQYGEELNGANTARYAMRTGNNYEEKWTLKAGYQEIENWGFKGYRYINILNCPVALEVSNLDSVLLAQAFDSSQSSFDSSSPVLNDVYDYLKYSMQAFSQDLYVDSQTRERGNYEGDALVNQLSQYAVERKYSLARFSQEDLLYNATWPLEYKQMNVMGMWEDYMYTGNKDALAPNWTAMRTKTASTNGHANSKFDDPVGLVYNSTTSSSSGNATLVDWPEGERDGYEQSTALYNTVINAFHYQAYTDLSKIADLLGNTDDKDLFAGIADTIKTNMNDKLISASTNLFIDGLKSTGVASTHSAQHAVTFPISMGITDDPAVLAAAAKNVEQNGMKVSVYGSHFVLDAMYAANRGDVALGLMEEKESVRSWGHLIYDLGATLGTEAWDPGLKSNMTFSHAWSAAPLNNIVRGMFGVRPLEPGFSKMQIKLQPGDIEWAKIKTPTIKGDVCVDYTADSATPGIGLEAKITIPANTTAKIYIPAESTLSDTIVLDGEEITGVKQDGYFVLDNVGSGTHLFELYGGYSATLEATDDPGDMYEGEQGELALALLNNFDAPIAIPENAVITYSSNKDGIAFVDENGKLQYVAAGKATITAKIALPQPNRDDYVVTAKVDIVVKPIFISDLSLTADASDIIIGEDTGVTLSAKYQTGKDVPLTIDEYTSSDPSVATVDSTGKVTGVAKGTATITALSSDGMYYLDNSNKDAYDFVDTTIFEDDFENNSNFPGLTASGGVLQVGKSKNALYANGLNWRDYVVETDFRINEVAASLWFRGQNSTNNYLWQFRADGTLKVHVFKSGMGWSENFQLLATIPIELNEGTNHAEIVVMGDTISTYLNGEFVDSRKDIHQPMGSVGFRNGGSESSEFDYIKVSQRKLATSCDVSVTRYPLSIPGKITAPRTVTAGEGTDLEYIISLGGVKDVNTFDLAMTYDTSVLRLKEVVGIGAFETATFLKIPKATTSTYRVFLMSILSYTQQPDAGAIKLVFERLKDEHGTDASVKVDALTLGAVGEEDDPGDVPVTFAKDTATTTIVNWAKQCDVNKDGKLSISDLSYAIKYYTVAEGDANWNKAKQADVNMDGVVDMADLIIISNYLP